MTKKPKQYTKILPDISVQLMPLDDRSKGENEQAIDAAFGYRGEARLRVQMGVYGPGTEMNPKPRYWWLLGESVTVVARTEEAVEYIRQELRKFLVGLDGKRL